jgi:hypothetical protein
VNVYETTKEEVLHFLLLDLKSGDRLLDVEHDAYFTFVSYYPNFVTLVHPAGKCTRHFYSFLWKLKRTPFFKKSYPLPDMAKMEHSEWLASILAQQEWLADRVKPVWND